MLSDEQKAALFEQLHAKDLSAVEQELAQGVYGRLEDVRSRAPLVKNWVDEQKGRNIREQRTQELGFARAANEIARQANQIAERANIKSGNANKLSLVAIAASILGVVLAYLMRK